MEVGDTTVQGERRQFQHGCITPLRPCLSAAPRPYSRPINCLVIPPGVKRQSAISDTGVTSAALPVMKHSEKSVQLRPQDAPLDELDSAPARKLDHVSAA